MYRFINYTAKVTEMSVSGHSSCAIPGRPARVAEPKQFLREAMLPPAEPQLDLRAALSLMGEKKYHGAADILKRMFFESPRDLHIVNLAIRACSLAGDIHSATAIFKHAAAQKLADGTTYDRMASAYMRHEMFERAEGVLAAAARACDGKAGHLYAKHILAHHERGRAAEAGKLFEAATKNGAANPQVYCVMVSSCVKAGDFDAAASAFARAIESGVSDPVVCSVAIRAYGKAGRLEDARNAFNTAVAKGLADHSVYQSMINAYTRNDEFQKAADVFRLAIWAGEKGIGTYSMGIDVYYKLGLFREAIRLIDGLPEDFRKTPRMMLKKAEVLRKLKRYRHAVSLMRRLLDSGEADQDERYLASTILGYSLKDQGRTEKAFDHFKALLGEIPAASLHYARAVCGLVFSWQRLGCDRRLGRAAIVPMIGILESRKKGASSHLLLDIEHALRILCGHS